jgi:hypothetical protein
VGVVLREVLDRLERRRGLLRRRVRYRRIELLELRLQLLRPVAQQGQRSAALLVTRRVVGRRRGDDHRGEQAGDEHHGGDGGKRSKHGEL